MSQQINHPESQVQAVVAFAKDQHFSQAIASANQMTNSSLKANALSAIAEAIGNLNQPDKAAELLKEAIASANQMTNSSLKANALSAIAEAIGNLNQPDKAAELLKEVIASANQMTDSSDKADPLIAIAEAEANLKNWGQALKASQKCPSKDCEVELLAKILTVYAEQQHPELKKEEKSEE
ncbi:hypothetical protein VB715_18100 [Crocosphaera sp. UHCC 0190]|uniref:tetratricopeptide repeat protein n=1 Tax=Crocosphaera sp. UHCC 0190 TaxID=3110246 RepID=UPI002B21CF5F|nr:hypothetical protein [Crocosphaera sp. UHCC 0190]MEA5511690.1 hypothetical protein [Crocosphaera sp. UHCC 0190]